MKKAVLLSSSPPGTAKDTFTSPSPKAERQRARGPVRSRSSKCRPSEGHTACVAMEKDRIFSSFRKAKTKLAVYTLSASGGWILTMCQALAGLGGRDEVVQGRVQSPRSIWSQQQYKTQIKWILVLGKLISLHKMKAQGHTMKLRWTKVSWGRENSEGNGIMSWPARHGLSLEEYNQEERRREDTQREAKRDRRRSGPGVPGTWFQKAGQVARGNKMKANCPVNS